MLMNNLDREVAEAPEGSSSMAAPARRRARGLDYHRIIASLRSLESDETLLVQSGRAVGIFKTHEDAPRVLWRLACCRAASGRPGTSTIASPRWVSPCSGR